MLEFMLYTLLPMFKCHVRLKPMNQFQPERWARKLDARGWQLTCRQVQVVTPDEWPQSYSKTGYGFPGSSLDVSEKDLFVFYLLSKLLMALSITAQSGNDYQTPYTMFTEDFGFLLFCIKK